MCTLVTDYTCSLSLMTKFTVTAFTAVTLLPSLRFMMRWVRISCDDGCVSALCYSPSCQFSVPAKFVDTRFVTDGTLLHTNFIILK